MRRFIGLLLAGVVSLAALFYFGMRRHWPPVLNAVRRASRAFKPIVLKTAGTPGAPTSVVRHAGRRSGRHYETPVVAVPTPDGFAIALPYGPDVDWLKNVVAAGSATIVADGSEHTVTDPAVVPIDEVDSYFEDKEQRLHQRFAVTTAVRVRSTDGSNVA
jgi:deazaflavin-dependent oxidoreductase (nitroreductase family)